VARAYLIKIPYDRIDRGVFVIACGLISYKGGTTRIRVFNARVRVGGNGKRVVNTLLSSSFKKKLYICSRFLIQMATKKNLRILSYEGDNGEKRFQTETQYYSIPFKGDEFYMTYYKYMAPLFQIKSLHDVKVLWQLTQYAEFGTGVVVLSPERRKHIAKVTGIGLNNLPKHMKSLSNLGLIYGMRNDYVLSPVVFWRGSNKDRAEFFETDEGRRVVLEFRKVTDDGEQMPENLRTTFSEE
jgi:hypothetical protein